MKKRTGILIHSRYLRVPNWAEQMWGIPPDLLGHFPKAVLVVLQEEAEIVFLGCGLRSGPNGEMESEFNRQYILDNFHRLSEFAEFRGIDLKKAKERIKQILVLDRSSLSTAQEVAFAGKAFEDAGIEKVVSVTCPTHAPRSLNEALKFFSRPESKIAIHNISVQVSDIGWAPNSDVMVFEPPHMPKDLIAGALRQKIAKMLLDPVELQKIKKALDLL